MGDELTDEGSLTADFLTQVGARIRALRTDQGLTVQQLADRSEVSRRMLTQVELGQANPSLVSITRIARALGTETSELLQGTVPAGPISTRTPGDHVLVWSSESGSTAHLLETTSRGRAADLWRWRLAPGDRYQGHADPAHSQELFYVLDGTLTLTAGDQVATIPSGGSARLDSDRPYAYANEGGVPCVFVRTVSLTA